MVAHVLFTCVLIVCHRDLLSWCEQGVLLLNIRMTVKLKCQHSHKARGWEKFTQAVVKAIDDYGGCRVAQDAQAPQGVVFMAWGMQAQEVVAGLDKVRLHMLALTLCA